MAIDFDGITLALAARFAPAQITPPAGYDNIRTSTGNLPGQMVPLPAVLVFPESGDFEADTVKVGGRDSLHEFVIRFYYNQTGDLERDTVALRKWLGVLVDQLRGSVTLGGLVTSARISSWLIGLLPYAGLDYTGIELTVRVRINEPWSVTA